MILPRSNWKKVTVNPFTSHEFTDVCVGFRMLLVKQSLVMELRETLQGKDVGEGPDEPDVVEVPPCKSETRELAWLAHVAACAAT